MRTPISASSLLPEIEELHSRNTNAISISTKSTMDSSNNGYQFLFIAIPFGKVTIENPLHHVEQSLVTELSLAGYKVLPQNSTTARYTIVLEQLRINAYDFLLMRKISSTVKLKIIDAQQINTPVDIETAHSEFSRYAFEKELSAVLNKAVTKSVKQVVLHFQRSE